MMMMSPVFNDITSIKNDTSLKRVVILIYSMVLLAENISYTCQKIVKHFIVGLKDK